MRPSDTRKRHDATDRSKTRDSLSWYAHELEDDADMPAERRAHLTSRLRRMMRTYRTPTERDFAAVEERMYAATTDPEVPAVERRKLLASWLSSLKELGMVAKRLRGRDIEAAPRRKASPFAAPAASRPKRSPFSAPAPETETEGAPDESGHAAESDTRTGEKDGLRPDGDIPAA